MTHEQSDGTRRTVRPISDQPAALPPGHEPGGAPLADDQLEAVGGGVADDQSLGDALYDWAARVFGPAPK